MIRIVALICGLLCGFGLVLSGLFDPSFVQARFTQINLAGTSLAGTSLEHAGVWSLLLGTGVAIVVAACVILIARRKTPVFCDVMVPVAQVPVWKQLVGGALFGFGWGIAGYFPLAALVAVGLFAPGAAIFLASVLGGMVLLDVITNGGKFKIEGLRSRG